MSFAFNVRISAGTLMAERRQDTGFRYLHTREKVFDRKKNDSFLLWICVCLSVRLLS